MRADLRAFFENDDGNVGALGRRKLLQPDRGRKPGGPCAHDDDIELHRLALRKLLLLGDHGCTICFHIVSPLLRTLRGCTSYVPAKARFRQLD